jgi:hypothetical protein
MHASGIVTDDQEHRRRPVVALSVDPGSWLQPTSSPTQGRTRAVLIPGIGYSRGVAWYGHTNTAGKFFAQLVSGRQYVAMSAMNGYYSEFLDNAPDPTQATILAIRGDTTGITFSLRKKAPTDTGTMQGTVQDPGGNDVPARIICSPPERRDGRVVFTFTDSSGIFLVETSGGAAMSFILRWYAPSYQRPQCQRPHMAPTPTASGHGVHHTYGYRYHR